MIVFITYKWKSYFIISSWNIEYSKKSWNSVTEASDSSISMTRTQMFQKLLSFFVGKSWAMCNTTTQNTEGFTLPTPLPPPVFSWPHPSSHSHSCSLWSSASECPLCSPTEGVIYLYNHAPPHISLHIVYAFRCTQRPAWAFMHSSSAQVLCFCFLSFNPDAIVLLGNHQSCSCLPWKLFITTSIPMFLYELFHRSQQARAQTTLHIICHVGCSFWRKPKSVKVNS